MRRVSGKSEQVIKVTVAPTTDQDTDWTPEEVRVHPRGIRIHAGEGVGTRDFLADNTTAVKVELQEYRENDPSLVFVAVRAAALTFPALPEYNMMAYSEQISLSGAVRVRNLELLCRTILQSIDEARAAGWVGDQDESVEPGRFLGATAMSGPAESGVTAEADAGQVAPDAPVAEGTDEGRAVASVPPRWSSGESSVTREVHAQVIFGRHDGEDGFTREEVSGSIVWGDGPLTPDTSLYVDFPAKTEWEGVRAEEFDAHVNLLMELRDKMFKSSGCTFGPCPHEPDIQ